MVVTKSYPGFWEDLEKAGFIDFKHLAEDLSLFKEELLQQLEDGFFQNS